MTESRLTAVPSEGESFDVRSYLRPIWRRKWIVMAIVVLATAGTYLYASHKKKQYTASTLVYFQLADPTTPVSVIDTPGTTSQPPDGQQMVDITALITAQSVTQGVYQQLKLPIGSAGTVNASLLDTSAAANSGTSFIVISATSHSPTLAADLANSYVSVFLASRTAAEVSAADAAIRADRAELATLGTSAADASQRQSLLTQVTALRGIALNPSPGARQTTPAAVPSTPSSASPVRDAVFAAIIALFFSIAIVLGFELFDRRVVRVSAIESLYRLPVLAVLPHVRNPAPVVDAEPVVPDAMIETLRTLRINLRISGGNGGPRAIVVTSAVPGEGKSTIARDLALVYADAGDRTLLIDGDLRRPNIPRLFRLDETIGLSQVLTGEARLEDAVVHVIRPYRSAASRNGNVGNVAGDHPSVLPSGSLAVLVHGDLADNPVALLSSRAMKKLLEEARGTYDAVIIDTPPILAVSDAVMLLGMADVGVLIGRLGLITRENGKRITEVIARLPEARIAGVVVNDLRDSRFLGEGYGTQYSGYGSESYASGRRRAASLTKR
jgi:Mrp family chromosome partitioning ATPase